MKIYLIHSEPFGTPFLTASKAVMEYSVNVIRNHGEEPNVLEYEVKTQGKNYHDLATAKKVELPF